MNANLILRYIGVCVAVPFAFICADELFYLNRKLRKPIFKFIRFCDVLSGIIAIVLFVFSLIYENWIFYDALAICVCVGGIKLLTFASLRQAGLSFLITVLTSTIISVIFHYTLPRSYNDYASEIASPLFITLPDLITNLFKKCSWLPVLDVIIPGVLLSFLRKYDENYHTGFGGVYTIIGNLTFILSTGLWILIEALYPFSIPFSLISYTLLYGAIFLTSLKRN